MDCEYGYKQINKNTYIQNTRRTRTTHDVQN